MVHFSGSFRGSVSAARTPILATHTAAASSGRCFWSTAGRNPFPQVGILQAQLEEARKNLRVQEAEQKSLVEVPCYGPSQR